MLLPMQDNKCDIHIILTNTNVYLIGYDFEVIEKGSEFTK